VKPGPFILWAVVGLAGVALAGYVLARYCIPQASISSWFRSPFKNMAIGGNPFSLHQIGWALDLVPVTADIERAARKVFPKVVNEGDHIHVQWI
jgi:hypothetical protein